MKVVDSRVMHVVSGGATSGRLLSSVHDGVEVPLRRCCDNVTKKNSFRQTVGKTDRIQLADPMQALIRVQVLLDKRPTQPQHFAHSKRDHRLEARTEIARSRIVIGLCCSPRLSEHRMGRQITPLGCSHA